MAINLDTQNLQEYPGVTKRVTLDQEQIVPYDNEGDEVFLLSFSTTAYSNNTSRTAIQDLYVTDFKAGWCKSSGFKGTTFALDTDSCNLKVKLDATVSGSDGSGYYTITLDHNSGIPISGEVVAADMEDKIRAIADNLNTADTGFRLAYMNSSVEFVDGRFWIISGSLAKYYSGSSRTSVKVAAASSNDCSVLLGFDLAMDTEALASVSIKEALITATISGATTSGTTTMYLNQAVGASAYDCMMITNGTNTEYFQITAVPTSTTVQFNADNLTHTYTANLSKVQLLRQQDPDADPALWFSDVDSITRHGTKVIINQIDYSS